MRRAFAGTSALRLGAGQRRHHRGCGRRGSLLFPLRRGLLLGRGLLRGFLGRRLLGRLLRGFLLRRGALGGLLGRLRLLGLLCLLLGCHVIDLLVGLQIPAPLALAPAAHCRTCARKPYARSCNDARGAHRPEAIFLLCVRACHSISKTWTWVSASPAVRT